MEATPSHVHLFSFSLVFLSPLPLYLFFPFAGNNSYRFVSLMTLPLSTELAWWLDERTAGFPQRTRWSPGSCRSSLGRVWKWRAHQIRDHISFSRQTQLRSEPSSWRGIRIRFTIIITCGSCNFERRSQISENEIWNCTQNVRVPWDWLSAFSSLSSLLSCTHCLLFYCCSLTLLTDEIAQFASKLHLSICFKKLGWMRSNSGETTSIECHC